MRLLEAVLCACQLPAGEHTGMGILEAVLAVGGATAVEKCSVLTLASCKVLVRDKQGEAQCGSLLWWWQPRL